MEDTRLQRRHPLTAATFAALPHSHRNPCPQAGKAVALRSCWSSARPSMVTTLATSLPPVLSHPRRNPHPVRGCSLPSLRPLCVLHCPHFPGAEPLWPGTQDSGHLCANCCRDPESSLLACQFFHGWQFLSVLGRFLGDHLPIRPYILCLGTRHLSHFLFRY